MSHALTESQKFFDTPTLDGYKNLQRFAFEASLYDPTARQLLSIEASVATENPVRSLDGISLLPSFYQICPRLHYVNARIREILGEVDEMQDAIERLRICLRAITQTGDGTQKSPFSITFLPDQDDIVRSFGEQKRCQQTATGNRRQLDVITAHSGLDFWFDMTQIARRQSQIAQESMSAAQM